MRAAQALRTNPFKRAYSGYTHGRATISLTDRSESKRRVRLIGDVLNIAHDTRGVKMIIEIPNVVDFKEEDLIGHTNNDAMRHYHFVQQNIRTRAENSTIHEFMRKGTYSQSFKVSGDMHDAIIEFKNGLSSPIVENGPLCVH